MKISDEVRKLVIHLKAVKQQCEIEFKTANIVKNNSLDEETWERMMNVLINMKHIDNRIQMVLEDLEAVAAELESNEDVTKF